jgi:hypothetical protein
MAKPQGQTEPHGIGAWRQGDGPSASGLTHESFGAKGGETRAISPGQKVRCALSAIALFDFIDSKANLTNAAAMRPLVRISAKRRVDFERLAKAAGWQNLFSDRRPGGCLSTGETTTVMNKFFILLLAVFISGCSTLPPQYSALPTRCLVKGVSTDDSSVQIRAVDGGDVIWVRRYHIGDEVWLDPGVHKVSVMCSTSMSWGSYTVGTEVEVDVQPGYAYFLTTDPIKSISDKPHIEVTKKESK